MSSVTRYSLCILAALALAAPRAAAAGAAEGAAGGAAAGPAPATPAGDPVIARVVAAYGGRDALRRAAGVRQQGTVASGDAREGRLLRLFAKPDSLRVEIARPGEEPELRLSHAGKGSRNGADVTGTQPHHAMILQAARIALPFWLAEDPSRARAAGRIERDGAAWDALALELPGGLALVAEVDAEGRIVRSTGFMEVAGRRFEFVNDYSDFRSAGGVLFAFRERNFAGGRATGETRLEKVEVLAERPPPGAFRGAAPQRL